MKLLIPRGKQYVKNQRKAKKAKEKVCCSGKQRISPLLAAKEAQQAAPAMQKAILEQVLP